MTLLAAGCNALPAPGSGVPLAPSSTPNTSVVVGGITLRVSGVIRHDTYDVGTQTFKPNNPAHDDCLIVTAEILSGDTTQLDGWKVTVSDNADRTSEFALASTTTYDSGGRNSKRTWLFVVTRASSAFTLHLPEGKEIPLDALLASGPGLP